jgi:hypothetical protein
VSGFWVKQEDFDAFLKIAAELETVETFRLDSWVEHLRQHVDRRFQDAVNGFDIEGRPKVTHLISIMYIPNGTLGPHQGKARS